jgi:hypothetical protein
VNDRFDEELRRAARRLVTEDLPAGVLDPAVGPPVGIASGSRGLAPGFATGLAALAILVLATIVGLGPTTEPGATPTPTPPPSLLPSKGPGPVFRTTVDLVAHVIALDYRCNDGLPLPTSGPSAGLAVRQSAVCTAPADVGPLQAAIIVGESAAGDVVTVRLKANIVGADTPAARGAVAKALAEVVERAYADAPAGTVAGAYVITTLPALEPTPTNATTEVGGVQVTLERAEDGWYLITLVPVDPR